MDLATLLQLKESEDRVEFKAARKNFKYAGGQDSNPSDRRHCVLGYVSAFCNEGGGMLVLGVDDLHPHTVVGSNFAEGKEGALEGKIYADSKIRVRTEVLWEGTKRVLIIHIPGRPVGQPVTFEGVSLMRVGESLREMSHMELGAIYQEQEPDFSATICQGLQLADLDDQAIQVMVDRYAGKQNNAGFRSLDVRQVLSDLDLLRNGQLTYAALILLGKHQAIGRYLPQSSIHIEYRVQQGSIHFDDRLILKEPFFRGIETAWEYLNRRNGRVPIQQGPYMMDVPFFNEEVVRESLHNAIVHRNYRLQGEVVIKQSNESMDITSPGGFPLGVTEENILTVNSTPRNRLLADILLKTGVVERSGQGVDKLFKNTIQEAKGLPDYNQSDLFQVHLHLPAIVQDKAFILFLEQVREEGVELSLAEVLTLEKVRQKESFASVDKASVASLLDKGLVELTGKAAGRKYLLSKRYYEFSNQPAEYTRGKGLGVDQIWLHIVNHLRQFGSARIGDFETLFTNMLSREQVKSAVYALEDKDLLKREGKGKATKYSLSPAVSAAADPRQVGLDQLNRK